MKSITQLKDFSGLTVLVRTDYNVPVGIDGKVDASEAERIEKSLETIKYLQNGKAKIILISHIGKDKKESLKPVAEYLKNILPVNFIPTLDETTVSSVVSNMQNGEIIMLENLRQNAGEENNDDKFTQFLARLASLYVNEAFSVCHRAHASVVGIPQYIPSYAGIWLQKEIENLQKVSTSPEKPFVFILGGAKFQTKIPLIEKFEKMADEILIGGALANNFFKKIGFNIGASLIDKDANVSEFFQKENIKIPFDVVLKRGKGVGLAELKKDDVIVDIGDGTLEEWVKMIKGAKTILWNGPLGLYEEGFDTGSKRLIEAVSESGAFSVIGGGDTVKLIKDMKLEDKIAFISTGGGAMLEFLAEGHLVGIDALEQ